VDSKDVQRSLEQAVLDHAPPGAVIIGADISPDRKYAVALTLLPTAEYLMDDLFVWDGQWEEYAGGSGGGTNWTSLDNGESGVLRIAGEAPPGAEVVLVTYEGRRSRVPVRHGHFVFVEWNTRFAEDPLVEGFE
jgi:hypothetical protein